MSKCAPAGWVMALLVAGCSPTTEAPEKVREINRAVDEVIFARDEFAADPSMAWVEGIGRPSGALGTEKRTVQAAPSQDRDFQGKATVAVRRLVYRVRFVVPGVFRYRRAGLLPQAGELHVDVSERRLRARFVGPGWPVHEGSEVRLRDDMPGLYAFDGHGGRWLSSGEMAAWFDGKEDGRPRSGIRIGREFGTADNVDTGPGALLCALLAEWTNQPRDGLEGRCRAGSIPPGFRFGPWSADLTAIVPMRLPKHALRADAEDPPHIAARGHSGAMLSAAELDQLGPALSAGATPETPEGVGIKVLNQADARVILLAAGVPVGWVDAGHSAEFLLRAGNYRVGAMRPLGLVRLGPTPVTSPGELTISRPRSYAEPDASDVPSP